MSLFEKFYLNKKNRLAQLLEDTKAMLNVIVPELKDAKNPMDITLTLGQIERIKTTLTHDALELIYKYKLVNFNPTKNFGEVFLNFS